MDEAKAAKLPFEWLAHDGKSVIDSGNLMATDGQKARDLVVRALPEVDLDVIQIVVRPFREGSY